jgi:D-3-phosphoglycerate dehydrogenase
MFALARGVSQADSYMKAQRWEKKSLSGLELWQKTVGIIGLGRIGCEVAKRAKAFGMNVLAYDVMDIKKQSKELGIKATTIDEIIEKSDFITLHVPLVPQTKGMIGEKELRRMKKTAYLVNTSRGGVIDETALLKALEEGVIAGAGLDVFEQEPPTDWKLVKHPKVVATPHLSSSTNEAQERVGDLAADKVINEFKSRK